MTLFVLSRRAITRRTLLVAAAAAFAPATVIAATDPAASVSATGTLAGQVVDDRGNPAPGASVSITTPAGAVVTNAVSDAGGRYQIGSIADGRYTVVAAATDGAQSTTADIRVSGNAVTHADLMVAESTGAVQTPPVDAITITASRPQSARNTLSPSTGSSQYKFDEKTIDELPQGDNTPFNQILLQAPGVANDSYGQLHIRGDHNDIQYRLNGILLPDGVSGFGQVFDARFAKSITLNTGALPAQFGIRTAGVVDIETRDDVNGGEVGFYGGSHDTANPSFEYGQKVGKFSGYMTGQYLSSNLGVENPTDSSTAVHDWTEQGKGFANFSYDFSRTLKLTGIVAATTTRLEIPDNPGQPTDPDFVSALEASGVDTAGITSAGLNERQYERNQFEVLSLQGLGWHDLHYQVAAFDRESAVQYKPDPLGDLAFNGVAAQIKRKASAYGLQSDASLPLGEFHTLRFGASGEVEDDRADNTSTVFPTDPTTGAITGGPETLVDNNPKNGNTLGSVYLQDQWDLTKNLTVNYGLRYDKVSAYVNAQQLSPRLGLVDYITPYTTLHAGYARYFTPPPNELVATTSLTKFENTTNSSEVEENSPVQAERSHYFDAGVTHQFLPGLEMGLDGYYRYARNLLDEGQFGQALIFTPFNYQQGHVYGLEFSSTYHVQHFTGYFNAAESVAQATRVESGQFNFGPDELAYINNHYVYLDHDQRLTMSGGVSWQWKQTTLGMSGTYEDGLRRDFANTGKLNPDVQLDLSATQKVFLGEKLGNINLRLAALNVLDRKNEIRDGSGIGVGAPQYATRASVYFGIAKPFGAL